MSSTACQKKECLPEIRRGPLALSDGGRARSGKRREPRVFTAAEIRLDSEMQEVFGAVRGANGRVPHRGFARVIYGEAFPWRVLARWFVAARRARAPKAQLLAALSKLRGFVDKLYDDAPDLAA